MHRFIELQKEHIYIDNSIVLKYGSHIRIVKNYHEILYEGPMQDYKPLKFQNEEGMFVELFVYMQSGFFCLDKVYVKQERKVNMEYATVKNLIEQFTQQTRRYVNDSK